ncbi:unnamed protein product [Cladocopium goreaui]|uniref:Uncharacterized protein n=1 Tax=Cladocopium goreaui TaxID=2562237 RepID=A0A9P1DMB3_9DINO|nr:unnamed protein product [Cladocopium goreaui]
MIPVAPEAVDLPKPFGLGLAASESTEAESDNEENTSQSQFLVIPGANSVSNMSSTSQLQQALAQQLQTLNQLVQSCNDIFREDGIGMRMPTCGLSFSPAACTSPPILGTRPAGPSGGMHLPDKALPEVHMVPPVPQHWGYQQAVPKQKSQRQSKQVPAHAPVAGPRTAKVAGKNKMAKVKEVTEVMEVKEESLVAQNTATGKGGRHWKEKVPKTDSKTSEACGRWRMTEALGAEIHEDGLNCLN